LRIEESISCAWRQRSPCEAVRHGCAAGEQSGCERATLRSYISFQHMHSVA
jgi:hypothetical protein